MNLHPRRPTLLLALLATGLLAACQREAPPETTPATPAPADPVQPAPSPEPPAVAQVNQVYQCGELRVEAHFEPEGARVDVSGRELHLPQVEAASGVRYADGTDEFWTRGMTEAVLTLDGERHECVAVEEGVRSPWTQAREREIGFRAVGNEPGWLVEVPLGEQPQLHLVLDYGERELRVPGAEAFEDADGTSGYRGQADGVDVELRIRREDCTDSMSGEVFDASAEAHVGGDTFSGCGRFLFE